MTQVPFAEHARGVARLGKHLRHGDLPLPEGNVDGTFDLLHREFDQKGRRDHKLIPPSLLSPGVLALFWGRAMMRELN